MNRNFLFALSMTALLLNFIACDDKFKPASTEIAGTEIPSHESWNSTVMFADSSIVKAVLKAGHISVFSEKGFTLIDSGATVEFYREGEVVSTLTGMRGRIDDKTKDIEIIDSVKIAGSDSTKLSTSRLFWNNSTRKVSTEEFVRITTPYEEIQGHGFESDQSLSNYRIFEVSGTFSK